VSSAGTARLFVAVDPPAHTRERISAWARTALAHGGKDLHQARLRLLSSEMLHITICFLGSQPLGEIEAIEAALRRSAAPVGELSLGAPLWLPQRRPRALALEVHDEQMHLTELRARLKDTLSQEAGLELAAGRFRPHVTVARMPAGGVPQRLRVLMATPDLHFAAQSVTLYRSWLAADGASHESLLELDCIASPAQYPATDEG
jgi:2'-5' RNA ligase